MTKWWAVDTLEDGSIPVLGEFLRMRLTRNSGAAFSMFQDGGTIIGLVAAAVIVATWYFVPTLHHRLDVGGVAFVMGGAAGNLLDRIFRGDGFLDGAVIDFIDFSFFPTFNVADIAINVGVGLLLIGAFRKEH